MDNLSREKVELSLYELKQEELDLKLQLNRFQEKHAKLELDYDEIQQNTSAFHLLLSDVMSSVLQNLTECCNNEAMPTTISNFKENELLDKLKYVANSVDTTLRSLLDELAKVKTDKESMKEQLKLAKWAVSEMEHVGQEVDTLKQQMEQEKQVLEENWQQVKAMLVEKEKELATVEDIRQDTANQVTQLEVQLAVEKDENTLLKDLRQRLEYRLEEMDKEILEMMVDKEDLEQKLVVLQNDNAYLSATLAREKERLGRLVEMMRMEVEAFRMEAELSRNCLEDLRQNNPNPQDQRPIREMLTNRAWEHMGGGSQTRAYSQPPRATTPVHDQQLQASSSNQRRVVEPQAQVSHDQNSSQLSLETTSVTIDLAKIGNWEEDCGVSVTATLPDVTEDYIGINVMQDLPAAAVHTTALEFFQSHPAARLTPVTFESAIQCELIKEVEDKPIRTRSHTMDSLAFHKTSRLIRTISTDDENAGKDIELNLPSLLTDAKMTETKSSAPIISAPKMNSPKVTCSEETQQNSLLLSCVEEAANLEEHFAANVNQLLELNSQLETAVDVLKSEIWSLNNQLRKQLTEQEELLSKLRHSDDLLLVTRSENSSLKNELNKKKSS
uniref:Uncharacterized protein n=1 Tax=Ditylenchus dipsaci TaxID=166011 RepID=A0A915CYU1_9BILA